MQTDDGNFIITYNGEVYNYLNIRIGLESKGYKFHSKTDTEVVLKAFQEYGPECVNMFNGMFAFAIWDCSKKRLFLARDRYGIKPLYYFYNESIFLFASEIKSLLKYPRFDVEISLEALNEYFTFQNIFSDRTLFKNVFLLPPATYLTIDVRKNNVFEKYKFWKCNFESQSDHLSENDYIEELIRLFKQAVNRQLLKI
jgi:asparagine synthase (glutamine-hydrolysing)